MVHWYKSFEVATDYSKNVLIKMSNKFNFLEAAEIDVSPVSRFSAEQAESCQRRPKYVELQLMPNAIFASKHFNETYGMENWFDDLQVVNGKFEHKICVRLDKKSPFFSRIGVDTNEEKALLKAVTGLGYAAELLTLPRITCGTQPSDFNGNAFKNCFHVGEIVTVDEEGTYKVQHLSIIDQYGRVRAVVEFGKQVKAAQAELVALAKAVQAAPAAVTHVKANVAALPQEAPQASSLDVLDFGERVIVDAINSCKSFDELKEIYCANGTIDQDDNIYQFFENKYNEFKKKPG